MFFKMKAFYDRLLLLAGGVALLAVMTNTLPSFSASEWTPQMAARTPAAASVALSQARQFRHRLLSWWMGVSSEQCLLKGKRVTPLPGSSLR